MIQRVQTLYLLAVAILAATACFFPFATVDGQALRLSLGDNLLLPSTVLSALIPAVSFASIFLYRKRILQMRVNSFNMILMIFLTASLGFIVYWTHKQLPEASVRISWPCIVPLINLILTYLAIRRIGIDEAMVQAADRLR